MANVNFYLRNNKVKKATMINMLFTFENQKVKIPTGININPKYWNNSQQTARNLMEFNDHSKINKQLSIYKSIILDVYDNQCKEEGGTTPESIKRDFFASKDSPVKKIRQKTFWDYFDEFIEFKRNELPDIRDYDNSLRKHLKKTEELFGRSLSFSLLKEKNGGFIKRMDDYLTFEAINAKGEPGLSANTVGKQFKNLKVFLNWYFEKEPTASFSRKHMVTKTQEVDNIYLTESDLTKLANKELTNEYEARVRDLFIVGCETGLRFSDFIRITKDHVNNGNLHFRPKKTEGKVLNNKVVIPISSRLKNVLEKIFCEDPKDSICNLTEFNKTIMEICKNAKIDDEALITKKTAGKTIEHVYMKYELVSSHTCRRTFCTLKFLAGMPAQAIMKFSGHKTERAFLKYLKLDAELAAIKYVEFFK